VTATGAAVANWCRANRQQLGFTMAMNTDTGIRRLLRFAHDHLDMDLAWVSRFSDDVQVIQAFDGDAAKFGVGVGTELSLDDSYCVRVLDGRLEPVIADTRAHPVTRGLSVTDQLRLGAYVGTPLILDDGQIYGMLCSVNSRPHEGLEPRAAAALAAIADMLAEWITPYYRAELALITFRNRAEAMLAAGGLTVALQPVVRTIDNRTVIFEALARFPTDGYTTEEWFIAAHAAGSGLALETDAITAALHLLPQIPVGQRLAVNASADMIASGLVTTLLNDHPADRLIVELTERHLATDIAAFTAEVAALRHRGILIAIDDAGSGYASLHQILDLKADIVKLDRLLITGIDHDVVKRALVEAFVTFTRTVDVMLIAEGVETPAELDTLTALGVTHAQGYLLAPPEIVGTAGTPEATASGLTTDAGADFMQLGYDAAKRASGNDGH